MKFQRIAGRFAAGIMTGAILLTTFGGTALAEGEDSGKVTPVESVSYKKTVTTDGNTYAPKTAFKFELTAVTHNNDSAKYEGFQLLSGVAGGLTLADQGELAFAPVKDEVKSSYEKNGVIQVDGTKFTQPGVYHYKMKEIIPAAAEK